MGQRPGDGATRVTGRPLVQGFEDSQFKLDPVGFRWFEAWPVLIDQAGWYS